MVAVLYNPSYSAAATLTITLASLASDANLLIGRQSTTVNLNSNTTTSPMVDCLIGGKIKLGTSPTTGKVVEIWAFGSYDGTTYTADAGASDAGLTLIAGTKNLMRLLQSIDTISTTGTNYSWGPVSLAEAFGGMLPSKFGVWVVHSTGVALDSTGGNHEIKYTPVQLQSN